MSVLFNYPRFGASGQGPSADLGDTIDQSLRFKAGQNLRRTFGSPTNRNIWTASVWIKRTELGRRQDFFTAANDGLSNATLLEIAFNGNDQFFVGKASTTNSTTARFRDPNAWYHLVIVNDGTDIEQYVNNVLVSTWSGQGGSTGMNNNKEHSIGDNNFNSQTILRSQIYMAAFYFVDGQALDPTDFGKTNEDGVWVPENYTGTYGNNGFNLKFDSSGFNGSGGIGADHSGNGNDFTATGFETADVAMYSSMLFSDSTISSTASDINFNSTSTSWSSNTPPTGFNGNTGDFVQSDGTWIFRPTTPLANVTKVEVFCTNSSPNQQLFLNSANVGGSYTGSAFNTIYNGSATTINNIAGNFVNPNAGNGFSAIRINDSILIDNTDNDVDYLDTPTNNYATLNPLNFKSASLNFEHANLRAQFGGGGSHPGMVGFGMPGSSGKYYWEVTLKEQKEGGIGIVSEDFDLESGNTSFGTDTANGGQGWEWIVSEGRRDNNNVETPNSHTVPNVGDTIGFLLDTTAGTCTIEINGVAQTAGNGAEYTNIPTDKTIFPYFRLGGASGDANLDWNFGQMPFLFEPTDYKHVATNSLNEPTIKDSSDHFQALLGGGAGTFKFASEATDKTTEAIDFNELDQFTPTTTDVSGRSFILDTLVPTSSTSFTIASGWGWSGITATIRVSSDGTANSWTTTSSTQSMENSQTVTVSNSSNFRYIRIRHNSGTVNFGNITTTNQPLLGRAQSTFPTGLWWIKDRENIQNHQFVDSARGSSTAFTCPGDLTANYVAPTGSSVAWCWKYNASDPTENGFAIVQHTGNSTGSNTQNVAHNLGGVPDFFINFRTGDTVNPRTCWAWHSAAPVANQRFQLDNSVTGSTLTSHWGSPTSTNLVFGPGDITNANGFNFITYVWRAVPGYSAFGKYTANGNANGPYVEVGFKPALVIVKTISGANGSWQMYDSTRSPHNPNTLTLVADGTPIEVTSGNDMDFLSNGFKPRDNGSINNGSGNVYLYCAWAENPFGGENAPPATAR